ncbi:3'-5' exonuclease [Saccharospirillum mangrovi]|uniref:3'-5' exonuclease n=1 Tax=Saccharospirillum mangrovi TaxID=2161747 RepID=UPI000D3B81AB|nr:3'-5' exonuclease [Saccharospirillum mangrovi]
MAPPLPPPEQTLPIDTGLDWQARFAQLHAQARDPRLRAYYGAGMVSPQTPLSDVPFAAMDFETTGLNPQRHAIVSIGVVPFTLQRIQLPQSRHWLVQPQRPLLKQSVTFHHITDSDLTQAPDLSDILSDLLQALAGRVVVVHHRTIERGFFEAALQLRLGKSIEFPVVDTMEIEAQRHRQSSMSLWRRLLGRRPVSIRLADSRERYHLPYYPPHHALMDALASAELLQAQIAHRYDPDLPIGRLWL